MTPSDWRIMIRMVALLFLVVWIEPSSSLAFSSKFPLQATNNGNHASNDNNKNDIKNNRQNKKLKASSSPSPPKKKKGKAKSHEPLKMRLERALQKIESEKKKDTNYEETLKQSPERLVTLSELTAELDKQLKKLNIMNNKNNIVVGAGGSVGTVSGVDGVGKYSSTAMEWGLVQPAGDSMSSLLGHNIRIGDQAMERSDAVVTIVFGKSPSGDNVKHNDVVTVEYASRLRRLAASTSTTASTEKPHLIVFGGPSANAGRHYWESLSLSLEELGKNVEVVVCDTQTTVTKQSSRGDVDDKYEREAIRRAVEEVETRIPWWITQHTSPEKQQLGSLHVHFVLLSNTHHLCMLHDVHRRSPKQSALMEIVSLADQHIDDEDYMNSNYDINENEGERYDRPASADYYYDEDNRRESDRELLSPYDNNEDEDDDDDDDTDYFNNYDDRHDDYFDEQDDLYNIYYGLGRSRGRGRGVTGLGLAPSGRYRQQQPQRYIPPVRLRLETSWSFRYATYPFLYDNDDVTVFLGRCYVLSEELTPVYLNMVAVVDRAEFFQRDNYRKLAVVRRALVDLVEILIQGKFWVPKAGVQEALESALNHLGRCVDLVRPAGLLVNPVSKTEWVRALQSLEACRDEIRRTCDPDRALRPDEWPSGGAGAGVDPGPPFLTGERAPKTQGERSTPLGKGMETNDE